MAKIEAVYYRYGGVYGEEVDSVEDAIAYLTSGEEAGSLSGVGVFSDGEPVIVDGYLSANPPSPEEAAAMLKIYAKVSAA